MGKPEGERLARLEAHVDAMREEMRGLRDDIKLLSGQAQRWKGGFGLLLALGGIGGVMLSWALRKFGG